MNINRTGIVLTTSLGPLLVMFDLAAVAMVQGGIEIGFGPFGEAFPSMIGILGLVSWAIGITLLVIRKVEREKKRSSKTKSVFLKGRKGIKCYECGKWVNASHVGYQELVVCKCGASYNMFQEGPWDQDLNWEGYVSSKQGQKLRANDRRPGKISPPPRH